MDHDLLMVIYGALIGLGSSIITTLFQSWLNRRERKYLLKDEQKRKITSIYIPSPKETFQIQAELEKAKRENKEIHIGAVSKKDAIRMLVKSIYFKISILILLFCVATTFFFIKPTALNLYFIFVVLIGVFSAYLFSSKRNQ